MWPELTVIQFLIGYLVFWIVIFFLYGLICLIDEMQRELKKQHDNMKQHEMFQVVTNV